MKANNILSNFIKQTNEKYYQDIKEPYQKVLKKIKDNIQNNNYLKVSKFSFKNKNIILINVDNEKYYVTFLFKEVETLYDDNIYHFTNYLKSLKTNLKIIYNILYFHWGDTTLNNTGKIRYLAKDIKEHNETLINNINNFFNNKEILLKLLEKFFFIDERYHKPVSSIIIACETSIISYKKIEFLQLLVSNNTNNDSIIAIGPLTYQNKKRNVHFQKKYESKRNNVLIRFINPYKYLTNLNEK